MGYARDGNRKFDTPRGANGDATLSEILPIDSVRADRSDGRYRSGRVAFLF